MTDTAKFAAETASAFERSRTLPSSADDTAEGFTAIIALRDQPADWASGCAARIDRLRDLEPNWDSYGAKPVDPASIEVAKQLIHALAQVNGIGCPRVAASPAGHIALSWEWHDHARELDLEIRSDGTIRYAYIDEHQPSDDVEGETTDVNQITHLLTKW